MLVVSQRRDLSRKLYDRHHELFGVVAHLSITLDTELQGGVTPRNKCVKPLKKRQLHQFSMGVEAAGGEHIARARVRVMGSVANCGTSIARVRHGVFGDPHGRRPSPD